MSIEDDYQRLRRVQEAGELLHLYKQAEEGATSRLVVWDPIFPCDTTVKFGDGYFYRARMVRVSGTEFEGNQAHFSNVGGLDPYLFVACREAFSPPSGPHVVDYVSDRWVAQDGASFTAFPGCPDSGCPSWSVIFQVTGFAPCRSAAGTYCRVSLAGVMIAEGTTDASGYLPLLMPKLLVPAGSTIDYTVTDPYGVVQTGSAVVGVLPFCDARVTHLVACAPMPATLTLTMTSNDASNTIGNLVGVPIVLTLQNPLGHCAGVNSLQPATYSATVANLAGFYQCCELSTGGVYFNCDSMQYTSTTVTYQQPGIVTWTNGGGSCVPGKVSKPTSSQGRYDSTVGGPGGYVDGSECPTVNRGVHFNLGAVGILTA